MKAAFHLGRSLTREQKQQLGFMRGHTPCHATLTETLRILDARAVADILGAVVMADNGDDRRARRTLAETQRSNAKRL